MAISKLGFLGSPGIVFESNLVEIVKNLWEAQVWCKTMKKKIERVLTLFDLRSNLGLTKGILVILVERGTLGALMHEWVVPHHFVCSRSPMERKYYFEIFRGLACKSKADKIRYLQLPLLYLIPWVQWEVSDKEHDFIFLSPLNCMWRRFMDQERTLPDWINLL